MLWKQCLINFEIRFVGDIVTTATCPFWPKGSWQHSITFQYFQTVLRSVMAKRSSVEAFPDDVMEGRTVVQRVTDACQILCRQRGHCCCSHNGSEGEESTTVSGNSPTRDGATSDGPTGDCDSDHDQDECSNGSSTPWVIPDESDWERSPFTFDWSPRQEVEPEPTSTYQGLGQDPTPPPMSSVLNSIPRTPLGPPPPSPVVRRGQPVPQTPPELLMGLPASPVVRRGQPVPQTPPELLMGASPPTPDNLVMGDPYPGLTVQMTSLVVGLCVHLLPYLVEGHLARRALGHGSPQNRRF